ncbi:MAG: DNA-directed RNA polymerase subunit alpha [Proteobacteria bacterium]|nr:DNA-directed RNA polymerase subunit alpha [Pseudomonadota bacterium]MCH9757785.1 DNA-directed RNA polymerase subunit alpha [Pseudomonadota bacterium]
MTETTNTALTPQITDIRSIKPFHALVTIEPLERGFGHTLGNALRRVMMSSIPGYAATEVKIEGVVHEYDRVDGMREDVVWLLLNLKKVIFRVIDEDSIVVRINKEGPGTVTAGDIETPHNVEILNKDHVLATLTKKGKLVMEITIQKGTGYESTAMRESKISKRFGVIYLDAQYSPVRRVAFTVESTRVANRTDLDRLILDIETNGIMDFEEVIQKSAMTMIEQLSIFAKIDKQQIGLESTVSNTVDRVASDHPLLSEEVSAMGLSVRSQNCLRKENIRYVGDLVKKSEKELMKTPHLGRKSLVEIKVLLDGFNLHLGMDLPNWSTPNNSR